MIATTMRFLRSAAVLAALLPVLLMSASCGDDDVTPTNPTGVANVTGTWTGTYRISACTDTLNGAAGTACAALVGPSAPRQPIRLALQQTDDRLVGNIEFTGWTTRSLVVSGVVQAGGAVLLEGTTSWTEAVCPTVVTPAPGRLTISGWISNVNRAVDGMTGDFRLVTTTRTAPCAFGEVSIQADTLTIARQ